MTKNYLIKIINLETILLHFVLPIILHFAFRKMEKENELIQWYVCGLLNLFVDFCYLIFLLIFVADLTVVFIRITCPCNEHPLTPHFYIAKVGFTRVYIFFLFLLQNIDCGYSLEPPR